MMKGIRWSFVGIVLWAFHCTAQSVAPIERLLVEISILEAKGDYSAAYFYSKKAIDDPSCSPANTISLAYHLAYNADATDRFSEADAAVRTAEQMLLSAPIPVAQQAPVFTAGTQWYLYRGEAKKALQFIQRWSTDSDKRTPYDQMQWDWCTAKIQFQLGYAASLLPKVEQNTLRLSQLFLQDGVYAPDGTVSTASLSGFQQTSRQLLWARYIILQAAILNSQGEYEKNRVFINQQLKGLTQQIQNKEGLKAALLYYKALSEQALHDYRSAEQHCKQAAALGLQFFKPHAPIQQNIERLLVQALRMQGKMEEAAYYHNDANVKVYSKYSKKDIGYFTIYEEEIKAALAGGQVETARQIYSDIRWSDDLPAHHPVRIRRKQLSIQIALRQYQWSAVENEWKELEILYDSLVGQQHPAYAMIWKQQADFYQTYRNNWSKGQQLYATILQSQAYTEWGPASPLIQNTIYGLVQNYYIHNTSTPAFEILNKELQRTAAYPQLQAYYTALAMGVHTQVGEFIDAEKEVTEIQQWSNQWDYTQYPHLYEEVLQAQVNLYTQKGEYIRANAYVDQWNTFKKSYTEKRMDTLEADARIAYLYLKEGKFVLSDRILEKQLKEVTVLYGPDNYYRIPILHQLAEQAIYLGNFTNTDVYLSEAFSILKVTDGLETQEYAMNALLYAKLYHEIGDYEKAEQSIAKAYEYYKSKFQGSKSGELLNQYALLAYEADYFARKKDLHSVGKLDKWFVQSFDIIQQKATSESGLYAEGLENQIVYLILSKRYKEALEQINKARQIWNSVSGPSTLHHAQLDYLQGKVLEQTHKYKEALESYVSCKNLYKTIFDDKHPGYTQALSSVAQMHYTLGDVSKAVDEITECSNKSLFYIQKVFPYLSEREKNSYWNKTKTSIEFLNTVAFENADKYPQLVEQAVNLQLQTKAILLNSLVKIKNKILSTGDTAAAALYHRWQETRENLTLAYALPVAERKANNLDIAQLEESLEKIEKGLSVYTDEFTKHKNRHAVYNYQWKEIRKRLNETEIALEVIPFRYYHKGFTDTIWYVVVAIDAVQDAPRFIILKNGQQLESKYLKYYRNVIKFDLPDTHVHTYFWKDIETLIQPKQSTIYFAADGVYTQINIETIRTNSGQLLLQEKRIITIGSCRDIITTPPSKGGSFGTKNIVLVGNPTYYTSTPENQQSVAALEGTANEVLSIQRLMEQQKWKSKVWLNTAATEDTVKQVLAPTVLHISTHGFFWNQNTANASEWVQEESMNPLQLSGLLLANGGDLLQLKNIYSINSGNGILTAYEAMNLNLDRTEIVILSACETGLGEVHIGEGVFGLQRAFTVAGSKCIVMSLFKVSDEVTTMLMQYFYTYWLQTGNKHEAFVQAKVELMKTYPNPRYWGAFVMTGME
ncbi:MAG: CHAT domain-containing protein [Cytophagaceae bacterium]|jgi:CHAT domain-containing protein|nr:CHAT domain-containing protein [Cytophagaceae bacterium]